MQFCGRRLNLRFYSPLSIVIRIVEFFDVFAIHKALILDRIISTVVENTHGRYFIALGSKLRNLNIYENRSTTIAMIFYEIAAYFEIRLKWFKNHNSRTLLYYQSMKTIRFFRRSLIQGSGTRQIFQIKFYIYLREQFQITLYWFLKNKRNSYRRCMVASPSKMWACTIRGQ